MNPNRLIALISAAWIAMVSALMLVAGATLLELTVLAVAAGLIGGACVLADLG
jgi:hypothetical protein